MTPDSPLTTDLYQLNMVQAYLDRGEDKEAVFEFFVRKLPPLGVFRQPAIADVFDELFDVSVLRVDVGALIHARQERGLPVLRLDDGEPAGAHGDKARQILILSPQSVERPGTHAWARLDRVAAIHQ